MNPFASAMEQPWAPISAPQRPGKRRVPVADYLNAGSLPDALD